MYNICADWSLFKSEFLEHLNEIKNDGMLKVADRRLCKSHVLFFSNVFSKLAGCNFIKLAGTFLNYYQYVAQQ